MVDTGIFLNLDIYDEGQLNNKRIKTCIGCMKSYRNKSG